jgi:diaminohydroxyphosphoribosylaminopyrimidine deaminase / 5-amino-6-(5-phosphoribosylamino)uracil reductase
MGRAISLARTAVGRVSPNPPVGAIIVRDGRVVGEGATQPPGGPHAEVVALSQAADLARGAAIYVTLEPCSFRGRTPPCSDALIAAGIARAHIATVDLHPRVSGSGIDQLRRSGIEVVLGEQEEEARSLSEAFFKWSITGHPFVIAKYGMTLDGKIATVSGDSRWVTGEASRERVHAMRCSVDAIMVGIGTVISDDPSLTARPSGVIQERQPLRVVVDSQCKLPLTSKLASPDLAGGTLVLTTANRDIIAASRLEENGIELVEIAAGPDGRVDLTCAMEYLAARGVTSVLVEGGGRVTASLLAADLIDKIVAFIAPKIIGGATAMSPVEGEGISLMSGATPLRQVEVERVNGDVLVTGRIGSWSL